MVVTNDIILYGVLEKLMVEVLKNSCVKCIATFLDPGPHGMTLNPFSTACPNNIYLVWCIQSECSILVWRAHQASLIGWLLMFSYIISWLQLWWDISCFHAFLFSFLPFFSPRPIDESDFMFWVDACQQELHNKVMHNMHCILDHVCDCKARSPNSVQALHCNNTLADVFSTSIFLLQLLRLHNLLHTRSFWPRFYQ